MQVLSQTEIMLISGGREVVNGQRKPSPSLNRPTPGESEHGREINDLFGALTSLGSWIGISLADWIHPAPDIRN